MANVSKFCDNCGTKFNRAKHKELEKLWGMKTPLPYDPQYCNWCIGLVCEICEGKDFSGYDQLGFRDEFYKTRNTSSPAEKTCSPCRLLREWQEKDTTRGDDPDTTFKSVIPYLKSPENLTLSNLENAYGKKISKERQAKYLEEMQEKDRKRREILEQEEKEKAEKLIEEEIEWIPPTDDQKWTESDLEIKQRRESRLHKENLEKRKELEEIRTRKESLAREEAKRKQDESDARWNFPINLAIVILLLVGLFSCLDSFNDSDGSCSAEYTVDC